MYALTATPFRPFSLNLPGGRLREFDRPQVMGILNVTPDSFYADSRSADEDSVRRRIHTMLEEGADMIDIGAYSSRPGAGVVSESEELRRLDMGLSILRSVDSAIPVSVDTFRAGVARRAVASLGADIVNDISGGSLDSDMWPTVADLRVPYVLMHMRGTPQDMMSHTDYGDVSADVIADLAGRLARLADMGVSDVIVDPGFGFSKTVAQNYRLMHDLPLFGGLGRPLLVGVSRKSMITRPLGITASDALPGTVTLGALSVALAGASILRVHDVAAARQSLEVVGYVMNPSSVPAAFS